MIVPMQTVLLLLLALKAISTAAAVTEIEYTYYYS
jgi:hypothetical protein